MSNVFLPVRALERTLSLLHVDHEDRRLHGQRLLDNVCYNLGYNFTSQDRIEVKYHPNWTDQYEYFHNGVRIERARAVSLIGEI